MAFDGGASGRAGGANKEDSRVIYLIRNKANGYVKIGFSKDPWARLASLQTGSSDDLVLLGKTSGSLEMEANLHQAFRTKRIRGEWFRLSPADCRSILNPPPLTTVMEWIAAGLFDNEDEIRGAMKLANQQALEGAGENTAHWLGMKGDQFDQWMRSPLEVVEDEPL
jgi:hypothetical protein